MLTPAKEALWRKWVGSTSSTCCPRASTSATLYDIGFDKPEAHAIAKDGAMYYAFYADDWNGKRATARLERRAAIACATCSTTWIWARSMRKSIPCNARFKRFVLLQAEARMNLATRAVAPWLVFALATVALWGVWGALAGLSAQHGFPDTLVYCVWALTMIPPALWVLASNGWKLDARRARSRTA